MFVGSNDEIPRFNDLMAQLDQYRTEEIELVSVVGGLKFLELVSELDFHRITLFDKNINELTKVVRVLEELRERSYEDYDHFRDTADYIAELVFDEDSVLEYDGISTSMETLLPPNEYPQYRWDPTKAEYKSARSSVLSDLNPDLYFGTPEIDAEGRTVLVYLSNLHEVEWEIGAGIRGYQPNLDPGDWEFETIRNASTVIHVGANSFEPHNEESWTNWLGRICKGDLKSFVSHLIDKFVFDDGHINEHVTSASLYRHDLVARYTDSPVLRVSSPERRGSPGNYERCIELTELLKGSPSERFRTCLLDDVLRECTEKNGSVVSVDRTLESRLSAFERVIVTEHTDRAKHCDSEVSISNLNQLERIVAGVMTDEYEIEAVRHVPGNGIPDHDMLVVAARDSVVG